MTVTDNARSPGDPPNSRNEFPAALEQHGKQEGFIAWSDYERDCQEAGEPLCFETRQPIAGKDIKFVPLRWHGFFGESNLRVPVIGHDTDKEWSNETKAWIEVPADYDENSTTCPNCGCRFLRWKNGSPWQRRTISGKHKACSLFCKRKLERKQDNRRARKRREWARGVRDCAECGETFTPKRTDSVYCSNACRQKSYRQRVTDNARSAGAPVTSRNGGDTA